MTVIIQGLLLEASKEQRDLEAIFGDFQNKCGLLDFVGHLTSWGLREFSTASNYSTDETVLVRWNYNYNIDSLHQYLQESVGKLIDDSAPKLLFQY